MSYDGAWSWGTLVSDVVVAGYCCTGMPAERGEDLVAGCSGECWNMAVPGIEASVGGG